MGILIIITKEYEIVRCFFAYRKYRH